MKLVIDIPDNMQDMCQWHKDGICALTGIEVDIIAAAIVKGTTFPDNATNGDVIKALFPKGKEINLVYSLEYRIDDEVTLLGILNWWNAPYKAGDTE